MSTTALFGVLVDAVAVELPPDAPFVDSASLDAPDISTSSAEAGRRLETANDASVAPVWMKFLRDWKSEALSASSECSTYPSKNSRHFFVYNQNSSIMTVRW